MKGISLRAVTTAGWAVCLVISVAEPAPCDGGQQVQLTTVLRLLTDVDQLPYLKPWSCRQFSSYDRSGGNADAGNFLGKRDGEVVLCESDGPGAIVRIWSANPTGMMRIFIDDKEAPALECPMRDFLEGRVGPIRPPIAMPSSGGAVSYFPIPFSHKIVVTVTDPGPMYYHIVVVRFPADWKVRSFRFPLSEEEIQALNEVIRRWQSPPALPAQLEWLSVTVPPGKSVRFLTLQGPAVVKGLFVRLKSGPFIAWRKSVLRVYWDGERDPSIEAPLSDFFGSGFGPVYIRSLFLGFTPEGDGYCFFPMPFSKAAVAEIQNGCRESVTYQIGYKKETVPEPEIGRMGTFHARWFWWFTEKGTSHLLMKATGGPGHYVGAAMTMQSAGGLGFLEGDEIFEADGVRVFNGTGTEDYFNSGWYFLTGPVVSRLHGCVRRTGDSVIAYRFHITDIVPWKKEFVAQIEHGGTNDTEGVEYSSVAYWYQREPHTVTFRTPESHYLKFPHLPFRLPARSAVAAESAEDRSGAESLPLFRFSESAGMNALVLRPITNNVRLKVKAPAADLVRLVGYFVKRHDFGKVKVYLDQHFLGWVDCKGSDALGSVFSVDFGEQKVTRESRVGLVTDGKTTVAVLGFSLESRSPFITEWFVCGPYPNLHDKGLDEVFAPETATSFDRALTVTQWKRATARDGVLNLTPLFQPSANIVAYATVQIVSPDERDTALLIGSDDGVKVWLNGKEVHRHHVRRPLTVDSDLVPIHLNAGANWLLVKVENGGGDFALSIRVLDPEKKLMFRLSDRSEGGKGGEGQ